MSSQHTSFFSQPFSVQWRKALVSAPRLVPLGILKYTSAEGPHPFVLNLPSRGKYLIPCYVFVPQQIEADKDANGLPVIIDFHGGGFVLGSCLEQGPFCAKMARDLGAVVICVDYRMGPIDKFPAAIEDGEDVLRAVLDDKSKAGKELRDAVAKRLTSDEKKALRKARKLAKKNLKSEAKSQKRQDRKDRKSRKNGGELAVPSSRDSSTSSRNDEKGGLLRPTLEKSALSSSGLKRPPISRSTTASSTGSIASLSRVSTTDSTTLRYIPTSASNASLSAASSTDSLGRLGPIPILDPSRIALSGFSSGGNLILNLALSIPASEPFVKEDWLSPFTHDYPTPIPLLLYYPSFDCRQLPSERTHPKGLEASGGFWSEANDLLMPTYLPRSQAAHPRASPGLAELKYGVAGRAGSVSADGPEPTAHEKAFKNYGLHPQARMHLILPTLDSLSEQSEEWVRKVEAQGRGEHLVVERYEGMKHGWTQMPESWLTVDEQRTRLEAFERSITFVRRFWEGGAAAGAARCTEIEEAREEQALEITESLPNIKIHDSMN